MAAIHTSIMQTSAFLSPPFVFSRLRIPSNSRFYPVHLLCNPIHLDRQQLLRFPRAQTPDFQSCRSENSSFNPKESSVVVLPSYVLPLFIITPSAFVNFLGGDNIHTIPFVLFGMFLLSISINIGFIISSTAFAFIRRSTNNTFLPVKVWKYAKISMWTSLPIILYSNESENQNEKPLAHFSPIVCYRGQLIDAFQDLSWPFQKQSNIPSLFVYSLHLLYSTRTFPRLACIHSAPKPSLPVLSSLLSLQHALITSSPNVWSTFLRPKPHPTHPLQSCLIIPRPYAYRISNTAVETFIISLFSCVAAAVNAQLSRYDLHHAHAFFSARTGALGLLFHAREYPRKDENVFPYELGYCQPGSDVEGDEQSMQFRCVIWLLHVPGIAVLDGRDRLPCGTFCETEFGTRIADVYYFPAGVEKDSEVENPGLHVLPFVGHQREMM